MVQDMGSEDPGELLNPAGRVPGLVAPGKFSALWGKLPLAVRRVWPALVAGIAIRLILIPISLNTDLTVFAQTSAAMVYGLGPYAHPTVYPPFWVFYLNAVGRATALFVPGPQWFTSSAQIQTLYVTSSTLTPQYALTTTYVVIEKGSLLLFDLATAFLLYYVGVRQTGRTSTGVYLFAIWFLNPFVIILSSVHGSYDGVPTFCALASLVLALDRRPLVSGVAFSAGALIGVFPIFLLPLLVSVTWKSYRTTDFRPWRPLLRFIGGAASLSVPILVVPGLLSTYLSYAEVGPSRGAGLYQGFGFWGFLSIPDLKTVDVWLSNLPGIWTVTAFAFVAVLIAVMVATHFVRTRNVTGLDTRLWVLSAVATILGSFLIPEVFQPQYVVWILPFVALLTVGNRSFATLYALLSAIPAIFYFVLAGPFLNFLPLWYNYHLVNFETVKASLTYWVGIQPTTFPVMFVPAFASTALLAALTFRELFRELEAKAGSGGARE